MGLVSLSSADASREKPWSYDEQLCRRVSMIWMIFHPSGVRKNWKAFTPQWLKREPRWKR